MGHTSPAKRFTVRGLGAHSALVLAALAVTSVLAACKEEKAAVVAPTPVRVTTVALVPMTETRSYVGTIKPRIESDLGFRVGGKIIERLVDVGRRVEKDQVIARLDATDFKFATEAQEAELRAASSSRDQAVAAEERYKALLANGHVAAAAYEQRRATADEARERVEKAVRSLATGKNQVLYTELKADAAGVVSALPVEVGQVVAAGQTVARIARFGEKEAVVAIPEQKLDEIRTAKASVDIWANRSARYDAQLREVSPDADPTSRTYQARFSIPTADDTIALGMTATVVLLQTDNRQVARLPLAAVTSSGHGAEVFVVDADGQHVKRTPVGVIGYGQTDVVVGSGLMSGQRVVALGAHLLDDGRSIRIVETVATSTASLGSTRANHP